MTNAEARCNKSLRPRKPEGSLGRTAQDGHLDSTTPSDEGHHTAPATNYGIFRSYDIYFSAMCFDGDPFTCQCQNEGKTMEFFGPMTSISVDIYFLCVLMEILSHASAKNEGKNSGFQISHFYESYSNDIMAVKGLTNPKPTYLGNPGNGSNCET